MSAIAVQQMANRVAQLMEERLGVKGGTLAEALKRGGGRLPRKVRVAAEALAKADEMSRVPKLFLQVDQEAVAVDFDICVKHLNPLGRADRRIGAAQSVALSILTSLAVVVALVVALLMWRGFL